MGALETATTLSSERFAGRRAGTDAERRAATWLAAELTGGGREAAIETFWCRPEWAAAQAWHVSLGLAGSLLAVSHPKLGGILILLALLMVIADAATGFSPGRLLTFERASQNVVARAAEGDRRVRLIITANLDAGRAGLLYRRPPRLAAARARRLLGPLALGWAGCLVLLLAMLLVVAILRNGSSSRGVAVALQLAGTVALVVTLALLVELAISDPGPGAADNASGAGLALALLRALDAAPPANLAVELVLCGAGDGQALGLRRHLRARRLKAADVVVLGIAPCGAGSPVFLTSDGPLLPARTIQRLRELAAQAGAFAGATAHEARGSGPSLAAAARGLPAVTIGCLDEEGLVPRSHTPEDAAAALDGEAIGSLLGFGLALVDAIDVEVGRVRRA